MENILKDILDSEKLLKAVVSSPRKKSQPVRKIMVRPVIVRGEKIYQIEKHYENKVLHENISIDMLPSALSAFSEMFRQYNLFTDRSDIQILAKKPENPKVIRRKPSMADSHPAEHNRRKNYIIEDGVPCDFLVRLGVMTPEGKVVKRHYSKFRQINRFLEILADSMDIFDAGKDTLKIIDFGCGRSYLTFALYYYLVRILNRNVDITGLDLKENVIEECSLIASELGYEGLKFELGDIACYKDTSADIVVTLHACDTATDYAMINAVSWNTSLILSVPCCQHELFSQITEPCDNAFLKHGILKDKFTEILTNGLRGLALEASGYNVSMIEFTSLEHTAKNVMIKAVKRKSVNNDVCRRAVAEYTALKEKYSVSPSIDILCRQSENTEK